MCISELFGINVWFPLKDHMLFKLLYNLADPINSKIQGLKGPFIIHKNPRKEIEHYGIYQNWNSDL
nr:MAG TPA: hypothetical protein [Caudoviricetes sp.]